MSNCNPNKELPESSNRIQRSSFDFHQNYNTSIPQNFSERINIDTKNCSYNMLNNSSSDKLKESQDARSETVIPIDTINYDHLHHDRHHNAHQHYEFNDNLPTTFTSGHTPTNYRSRSAAHAAAGDNSIHRSSTQQSSTQQSSTLPTSTSSSSTPSSSTSQSSNANKNIILLNNIYNELSLLKKYVANHNNDKHYNNLEQSVTLHFDSNMRNSEETIHKFSLNLSSLKLRHVVKCDLLKAVIPKTRQLLDVTPEYPTGTHTLVLVESNGSGTLTTERTETIENLNYTATELETRLKASSTGQLSDTVIDVESGSSLFSSGKINKTGVAYLSDHTATITQVIKKMTCKLAYILGFVAFNDTDPFKEVCGFVNNCGGVYSITVTFDSNGDKTSGTISNNTAIKDLSTFLSTLNISTNEDYFKIGYNTNEHHYFITNNHSSDKITKITVNQNSTTDFTNIIGINTITQELKTGEKYNGSKKYILETHESTPNHGTHAAGTYQYSLVSKYHIKFTDTHYVYISIVELGQHQSYTLLTKKGYKYALQSIDLDENYQGVTFYRANEIDLLTNRFHAQNLNTITLELRDDHGNYYDCSSDWSGTLKFTLMSEKQFHEHHDMNNMPNNNMNNMPNNNMNNISNNNMNNISNNNMNNS